jgi:hypothetical protein
MMQIPSPDAVPSLLTYWALLAAVACFAVWPDSATAQPSSRRRLPRAVIALAVLTVTTASTAASLYLPACSESEIAAACGASEWCRACLRWACYLAGFGLFRF